MKSKEILVIVVALALSSIIFIVFVVYSTEKQDRADKASVISKPLFAQFYGSGDPRIETRTYLHFKENSTSKFTNLHNKWLFIQTIDHVLDYRIGGVLIDESQNKTLLLTDYDMMATVFEFDDKYRIKSIDSVDGNYTVKDFDNIGKKQHVIIKELRPNDIRDWGSSFIISSLGRITLESNPHWQSIKYILNEKFDCGILVTFADGTQQMRNEIPNLGEKTITVVENPLFRDEVCK